jgi:hypothetical protein
MTRAEWLSQCEDELKKLRPHLSDKITTTLALQLYSAKEHPRVAAREYHARQQPQKPAPAPAKRRVAK